MFYISNTYLYYNEYETKFIIKSIYLYIHLKIIFSKHIKVITKLYHLKDIWKNKMIHVIYFT